MEPKDTYQLKGCEILKVDKPIPTALEVKKNGKQIILLLPQSDESRDEWFKALTSCLNHPPKNPPLRTKTKNTGTFKMRMKKTLAGKVAISSAGKMVAKSSVPEPIQKLINALRILLARNIGENEAIIVEDNIIKLFVKCFCLEEDGELKIQEFNKMDIPMRQAFGLISKLRDQTVVRKIGDEELVDETLKKIREYLRLTETALTTILTPHLKPKSIQRIAVIFRHVGNPAFLKKAIVTPTPAELNESKVVFLEEEIDSLCIAMDKYLSHHFYQDES